MAQGKYIVLMKISHPAYALVRRSPNVQIRFKAIWRLKDNEFTC